MRPGFRSIFLLWLTLFTGASALLWYANGYRLFCDNALLCHIEDMPGALSLTLHLALTALLIVILAWTVARSATTRDQA